MRLTIVSPSAYPALVPGVVEFAGGAEFQLIMLARAMRDRGHTVSFVVGDYGQPAVDQAQGFDLYRAFALYAGNRKLRFLPDMFKLRAAVRASRPDVVNQRSTAFYTGQTCRFAQGTGAAFVFSLGIDYNCHRDLQGRAPWPIPALYGWGIHHADGVWAQTEEQAELMRANFDRADVFVVPNMLEVPAPREQSEDQGYVLWVGSLARRKRPEMFLELARRLPAHRFKMVGGPGEDPGYHLEIADAARQIANLEMVGFVPPDAMAPIYRSASVYVNTSALEGLPNTYLQSWSHGVPCVSAGVDPDGVIRRLELGGVGDGPEELAAVLGSLVSNPTQAREAGLRAHAHVAARHAIEHVGDRAEYLLLQAIEARATKSGAK